MTGPEASLLLWIICAVILTQTLGGVIARHPEERRARRWHWVAVAFAVCAAVVGMVSA